MRRLPDATGQGATEPAARAVRPNQALQATCGRALFQRQGPPGRTRLSLVVRPIPRASMPMATDSIAEIAIDEVGRLCVRPSTASFPFIWREAMEAHWDP